MIGICSQNMPEWNLVELAAFSQSLITIPLFTTFSKENFVHVLTQTEVTTIACHSSVALALIEAASDSASFTVVSDVKPQQETETKTETEKPDSNVSESTEATKPTNDNNDKTTHSESNSSANTSHASIHLKHIILIDPEFKSGTSIPSNLTDAASKFKISIQSLTAIETLGAENFVEPAPPGRSDVATICYTSGTTGLPKGVVLTHDNILAASYSIVNLVDCKKFLHIGNKDIHISYLTLAHVFERVAHHMLVSFGARIGYFHGVIPEISDDLATLKPTIMIGAPRVFERLYNKVIDEVRKVGGWKQKLFETALRTKLNALESSGRTSHAFYDALVFSKVRNRLGGKVRMLFSGSAPLPLHVMDFLRIAFSCDVYEGYGQTECAAAISLTLPGETRGGHIGAPLPNSQVRLVDIPSMNYTSSPPTQTANANDSAASSSDGSKISISNANIKSNQDAKNSNNQQFTQCGEIYMRGPQVFTGYYKDPKKTAEALKEGGWLATGDVGCWDPVDGRLIIIDRIKNMFKLSQGEFISPEQIEAVYTKHELIQTVLAYGDPMRSSVVGIIHPDLSQLSQWLISRKLADEKTLVASSPKDSPQPNPSDVKVSTTEAEAQDTQKTTSDMESMTPETIAAFLSEINSHARSNGLKGYECFSAVHITSVDFALIEANKTPTWKLRRDVIQKAYGDVIETLYKSKSQN
jgi:long-chain acyl-CoA synthetase